MDIVVNGFYSRFFVEYIECCNKLFIMMQGMC